MARHMVNNAPNTISTKQLVHFGQLIKTERFQKFDYKTAANLRFYGQAEPPEYDLCKVNVKLYVYYGSKDYTTPVKVNILSGKYLKIKVNLYFFGNLFLYRVSNI